MTDIPALILAHATLATEPHALPTPAPSAELETTLRLYRRRAQVRLNVEGFPRGLAKVA